MGKVRQGKAQLSREAVAELEGALEKLAAGIAEQMELLCGGEGGLVGDEAAAAQRDLDRMTRWAEKLRKLIGDARSDEEGEGAASESVDVAKVARIMEEAWGSVMRKAYGYPPGAAPK